jgi:hypothetical protein
MPSPGRRNNTEAIAGLHNKGKRAFALFDEASAIPEAVWETVEGALTDGGTEWFWAAFGNPTRTTGRFRECFAGGRFAHHWNPQQIDSRSVSMTNKAQIATWVNDYGEDSDFVRVRVRGNRRRRLEQFPMPLPANLVPAAAESPHGKRILRALCCFTRPKRHFRSLWRPKIRSAAVSRSKALLDI